MIRTLIKSERLGTLAFCKGSEVPCGLWLSFVVNRMRRPRARRHTMSMAAVVINVVVYEMLRA